MTNSDDTGKRDRLIEGAKRVIFERGVRASTLADFAEAAGVPVGNVYYYFKTKDELIAAVIDAHTCDIESVLGALDRVADPRQRLKTLAMRSADDAQRTARYGCAHGAICQELAKRDDDVGSRASKMIALTVDWAEAQFRLLRSPEARELAVSLVAAIQGAALLASSLGDPEILTRQAHRLASWIDDVAVTDDTAQSPPASSALFSPRVVAGGAPGEHDTARWFDAEVVTADRNSVDVDHKPAPDGRFEFGPVAHPLDDRVGVGEVREHFVRGGVRSARRRL